MATPLVRLQAEKRRRKKLQLCQTNLYYLMTEVLDYKWHAESGRGNWKGKGFSDRLHGAICNWYDFYRDESFMFLELPRFHHKTTMMVGMHVQQILRDPTITAYYFHGIEDLAGPVVEEVAWNLQFCDALRELEPIGMNPETGDEYNVLPPRGQKKFFTSSPSPSFTVTRHRHDRMPSLLGKGWRGESTGAHARACYLDDIISKKTVDDNQIGKVATWFKNTVIPVIDDLWIRAVGTTWEDWGLYKEWEASEDWRTLHIPCSVANVQDFREDVEWDQRHIRFPFDEDLKNPIYGPEAVDPMMVKRLELFMRQMGAEFRPQMGLDASPQGVKAWNEECEVWITDEGKPKTRGPAAFLKIVEDSHRDEVVTWKGPGFIAILSDPAPAGEREETVALGEDRPAGKKDYWSISAYKVRWRGDLLETFLLDGAASKEWSKKRGCQIAAKMALRWNTPFILHEAYGGLSIEYWSEQELACRNLGIPLMKKDREDKTIAFKMGREANAKNKRIAGLIATARADGFYMRQPKESEGAYKLWLHGDGKNAHSGLLPQLRSFLPTGKGKNSLRFDDHADNAGRCRDPIVVSYAPRINPTRASMEGDQSSTRNHRRLHRMSLEDIPSRARYIKI